MKKRWFISVCMAHTLACHAELLSWGLVMETMEEPLDYSIMLDDRFFCSVKLLMEPQYAS